MPPGPVNFTALKERLIRACFPPPGRGDCHVETREREPLIIMGEEIDELSRRFGHAREEIREGPPPPHRFR
jgi:hypothetical protein